MFKGVKELNIPDVVAEDVADKRKENARKTQKNILLEKLQRRRSKKNKCKENLDNLEKKDLIECLLLKYPAFNTNLREVQSQMHLRGAQALKLRGDKAPIKLITFLKFLQIAIPDRMYLTINQCKTIIEILFTKYFEEIFGGEENIFKGLSWDGKNHPNEQYSRWLEWGERRWQGDQTFYDEFIERLVRGTRQPGAVTQNKFIRMVQWIYYKLPILLDVLKTAKTSDGSKLTLRSENNEAFKKWRANWSHIDRFDRNSRNISYGQILNTLHVLHKEQLIAALNWMWGVGWDLSPGEAADVLNYQFQELHAGVVKKSRRKRDKRDKRNSRRRKTKAKSH